MVTTDDNAPERDKIFTEHFSDAMQMTPGRFIAMEGEWYRIESLLEDAEFGFRVNLVKEEPPKGEAPLCVLFFSGVPRAK
jgi:hypothetical protein